MRASRRPQGVGVCGLVTTWARETGASTNARRAGCCNGASENKVGEGGEEALSVRSIDSSFPKFTFPSGAGDEGGGLGGFHEEKKVSVFFSFSRSLLDDTDVLVLYKYISIFSMQAAGTKKTTGINAYRQAILFSVTNFFKERFMVYTKYGRFFSGR